MLIEMLDLFGWNVFFFQDILCVQIMSILAEEKFQNMFCLRNS